MCLASLGLGKTVEKFIPAIVDCINFGELCILTGTLNSVSNHHVHLLKDRLPTSHFEERVRVEGARGSDVLSKSMMLEALTWKLMKPAVEQYEQRIELLEGLAAKDPDLAIKVNRRLRSWNNGLTNNRGMLDGLGKGGLAQRKAGEEAGAITNFYSINMREDDLVQMLDVNEGSILHCLRERFKRDLV